jgi:hypothetical protein
MSSKYKIESSTSSGIGSIGERTTVVINTETGDRSRVKTGDHIHHEDNLNAIGKAIEKGKMTPIK